MIYIVNEIIRKDWDDKDHLKMLMVSDNPQDVIKMTKTMGDISFNNTFVTEIGTPQHPVNTPINNDLLYSRGTPMNVFLEIHSPNLMENSKERKKSIIVATDTEHLSELIYKETEANGYKCSLNHIDVSKITDMSGVFRGIEFNGDISKWNTSNVTNMGGMFWNSTFNGDISNWDVSNVTQMNSMFRDSEFNGDISNWNTSNVTEMLYIFEKSDFTQDLSNWKPYSLKSVEKIFNDCKAPHPYWAFYEDAESRKKQLTPMHCIHSLIVNWTIETNHL